MLNILGIALSFIGSIFLAFAITKNSEEDYFTSTEKPNKKRYITIIHLLPYRLGITFLIIGFLLQIISYPSFYKTLMDWVS